MPTNKNREMKLLKCVTDVIQIIFKQTLRNILIFFLYFVCEFIKKKKKINKVKNFFILSIMELNTRIGT